MPQLPRCRYCCHLRHLPAVPAVPAAQLLGMKGADMETDIWKIRVQLMKPVTWIPLIWGAHLAVLLCRAVAASGAAASGSAMRRPPGAQPTPSTLPPFYQSFDDQLRTRVPPP